MHHRLSPDRCWWWTGDTWAGPTYQQSGLSALVTFLSRFMGVLRVFPGAVVFSSNEEGLRGAANRAMNVERPVTVVHVDRAVAVICARFTPPWLNTAVVLLDPEALQGGTALVQFPGWQRRPLLKALSSAGFSVDVHRRAFSLGSDIGSAAELERFRRSRAAQSPE